MKTLFTLSLLFVSCLSFSQKGVGGATIYQSVSHDQVSNADAGCTAISLVIEHQVNNVTTTYTGSSINISPNNTSLVSVSIPAGGTIVSKKIKFVTADNSVALFDVVSGASTTYQASQNRCTNGMPTKTLVANCYTVSGTVIVNFFISTIL
jgi:hypothetical protein